MKCKNWQERPDIHYNTKVIKWRLCNGGNITWRLHEVCEKFTLLVKPKLKKRKDGKRNRKGENQYKSPLKKAMLKKKKYIRIKSINDCCIICETKKDLVIYFDTEERVFHFVKTKMLHAMYRKRLLSLTVDDLLYMTMKMISVFGKGETDRIMKIVAREIYSKSKNQNY